MRLPIYLYLLIFCFVCWSCRAASSNNETAATADVVKENGAAATPETLPPASLSTYNFLADSDSVRIDFEIDKEALEELPDGFLATIEFYLEETATKKFRIVSFEALKNGLSFPDSTNYQIELHSYEDREYQIFFEEAIYFNTANKIPVQLKMDIVRRQPSRSESVEIFPPAPSISVPDAPIRRPQPNVSRPKGIDQLEPQFLVEEIEESLAELDEEELTKRITARVLESIPDTMYLEERERLSILILSDTTQQFFNDFLQNDPALRDNAEQVETFLLSGVGNIMVSRLIDVDSAFSIQPLFARNQRFIDFVTKEPQRWEWYVTPKKAGKHLLTYALERIDVREDKEFSTSITSVLEKEILVVVKGGKTEPETAGFPWLWVVLGAIVLAMLVFFLFKRQKEKEAQKIRLPSENIRTLIAKGQTEKALDLLSASTITLSQERRREILMLESRWSSLESEINRGIISNEEAQIERNRIKDRILDVIDELS